MAQDLQQQRIDVVRRHMALEITHDWDGVIATFEHPRYELLGPGAVFDGEADVRRLLRDVAHPVSGPGQRSDRHRRDR